MPGRGTPPAPESTANDCTPGPGFAAGRRPHRHRYPSFADPSQRCHQRARLPALLQHPPGAVAHLGGRGWSALAHRRILARRQRPGRLDQHQVRRWRSWHRWTTLAMLAHAFLAVVTVTERDTAPTPTGLIALTVNESAASRRTTGLVTMAPRTPIPSTPFPLPTTPESMNPIYGCSTIAPREFPQRQREPIVESARVTICTRSVSVCRYFRRHLLP